MTKEEVRAVAIAKGRLFPGATVYDIGAGTGSIAVEAALIASRGKVFAVERNQNALSLIEANKQYFAADNLEVVPGDAPAALAGLPSADTIFVGGSGGALTDILAKAAEQLKNEGRIIVMAVTVETFYLALSYAQAKNFTAEAIGLTVARLEAIGSSHLWRSSNSVNIITLRKN